MPIYEYECEKCKKISSILERPERSKSFFNMLFGRQTKKCGFCGSKNLTRIISSFSVSSTQSTSDMLNEISKMGPVNFVPDTRPKGPPPGGCPYAQQHTPPAPEKKIDRINLS